MNELPRNKISERLLNRYLGEAKLSISPWNLLAFNFQTRSNNSKKFNLLLTAGILGAIAIILITTLENKIDTPIGSR